MTDNEFIKFNNRPRCYWCWFSSKTNTYFIFYSYAFWLIDKWWLNSKSQQSISHFNYDLVKQNNMEKNVINSNKGNQLNFLFVINCRFYFIVFIEFIFFFSDKYCLMFISGKMLIFLWWIFIMFITGNCAHNIIYYLSYEMLRFHNSFFLFQFAIWNSNEKPIEIKEVNILKLKLMLND